MDNNILQSYVSLDHDSHVYTDQDGNEYLSTSRFIETFKEKTDFKSIAGFVAKKRLKHFTKLAEERNSTVRSIAKLQPKFERGYTKESILKEWEMKKDEAIDKGNLIHNNVEKAGVFGKIEKDGYESYYKWFLEHFSRFKNKYYEQVVYLNYKGLRIAGTIDFCYFRKGPKSMIDLRDFKTNDYTKDTIVYDKIKAEWQNRDYNLCGACAHLEDSDMVKYNLQQSIYAFMLEYTLGLKIGTLGIIPMPWRQLVIPEVHYLSYMKHTVIAMLEEALVKNVNVEFQEYEEIIQL